VCVCGRRSVGRLIMQRIIRSSSELMRDGRGVCTCPRRGDEIICSATYDTARQNSISFRIVQASLVECYTQGEVTSKRLWPRYDRHFVGIRRYNELCQMAKIYRVLQIKLNHLV